MFTKGLGPGIRLKSSFLCFDFLKNGFYNLQHPEFWGKSNFEKTFKIFLKTYLEPLIFQGYFKKQFLHDIRYIYIFP